MPFSKLGLPPSLCSPLARLGYVQPTPVQSAAIPLAVTGVDVLARAQTGTGKTAAFGLPMIERLLARSGPPPIASATRARPRPHTRAGRAGPQGARDLRRDRCSSA